MLELRAPAEVARPLSVAGLRSRCSSCGIIALYALTGALLGMVIELLLNQVETGMGLIVGCLFGCHFGYKVKAERMQVRDMAGRLLHEARWPRLAQGERCYPAPPSDEATIKMLPQHQVTESDIASALAEHRTCSICIEEFSPGDTQCTLPCFHRFHGPCIETWLRRTGVCPICRVCVDAQAQPP